MGEFWILVIGIIVTIWTLGKFSDYLRQRQITKIENIRKQKREIGIERKNAEAIKRQNEKDIKVINTLATEKSKGFPFLTEAFNQYFETKDRELVNILRIKTHPALKASEQIRQISKERREAEKLGFRHTWRWHGEQAVG